MPNEKRLISRKPVSLQKTIGIQTNCQHYCGTGRMPGKIEPCCIALTEFVCKHKKCTFYKPQSK